MSVSIADALTQDLVMLSRLVARFFAPHQIRRQVKGKDAFDGTLFEASRLSASNIRRSMFGSRWRRQVAAAQGAGTVREMRG